MRKFEYKEEYTKSSWLDTIFLNEQGQEGWELIATEYSTGGMFGESRRHYLFKRMLPPEPKVKKGSKPIKFT